MPLDGQQPCRYTTHAPRTCAPPALPRTHLHTRSCTHTPPHPHTTFYACPLHTLPPPSPPHCNTYHIPTLLLPPATHMTPTPTTPHTHTVPTFTPIPLTLLPHHWTFTLPTFTHTRIGQNHTLPHTPWHSTHSILPSLHTHLGHPCSWDPITITVGVPYLVRYVCGDRSAHTHRACAPACGSCCLVSAPLPGLPHDTLRTQPLPVGAWTGLRYARVLRWRYARCATPHAALLPLRGTRACCTARLPPSRCRTTTTALRAAIQPALPPRLPPPLHIHYLPTYTPHLPRTLPHLPYRVYRMLALRRTTRVPTACLPYLCTAALHTLHRPSAPSHYPARLLPGLRYHTFTRNHTTYATTTPTLPLFIRSTFCLVRARTLPYVTVHFVPTQLFVPLAVGTAQFIPFSHTVYTAAAATFALRHLPRFSQPTTTVTAHPLTGYYIPALDLPSPHRTCHSIPRATTYTLLHYPPAYRIAYLPAAHSQFPTLLPPPAIVRWMTYPVSGLTLPAHSMVLRGHTFLRRFACG